MFHAGVWLSSTDGSAQESQVHIWLDPESGKAPCKLSAHAEAVQRLEFAPNGQMLLSADCKSFSLWSVAPRCTLLCTQALQACPSAVVFAASSKRIIATAERSLMLWDIACASGQASGSKGLPSSQVCPLLHKCTNAAVP